jgi:Xaa-Pro aminopeptidase
MAVTADPRQEAAFRALPRKLGLDAIVAMSPESFTGVSGVKIETMTSIRPRQAFAILPAAGEPELLVCSIERTWTASQSWIPTINTYVEFVQHPMDMLAERLTALGATHGRVGIDADYLPMASYQRLMQLLPGLQLVDSSAEIGAIRVIKTPTQIAVLEHAARGTHRAALEAMQASRLGDTEITMVQRIADGMIRYGADMALFLYLLTGDRTTTSHGKPSDRRINESEIIRFDVGGVYGAFASDFARTYSTGNPTALQRQTYAALRQVQGSAIDAIRPGAVAEDIWALCRDEYARHGIAFRMPLVGHSLGLEIHENPILRPGEKTRLAPGMVLNVEVSTSDATNTYYHTEDLLVVTEDGYRLLTLGLAPPEIPVIGTVVTPALA